MLEIISGNDAMVFYVTFLRGFGRGCKSARLVSKPPYFCNELLVSKIPQICEDHLDRNFLCLFFEDSKRASNWIQAFQKVDSHFSNNSSFDEDDMIPLTLSVSPNDLSPNSQTFY